jgi:dihydrodiol dehydrogenase / D-xylose 1-dehydrogenase (NADP)
MADAIGWGILGAGTIAAKFATDLIKAPDARLAAVGSRDLAKAQTFADQHGAQRAYGSYAAMLADPAVQIVYVATPHNFHLEHATLCLQAGKAVLCEKPMETDASRVARLIAEARSRKLFLMEAMWTRFLPVVAQARRWLAAGRIGEVRQVTVDFGFRSVLNPQGRLFNLALAGGATLDVGVYVVAMASMALGGLAPTSVQAAGAIGETGIDEQSAYLLRYASGALAQLSCAVRTNTPQVARIFGTEGWIEIPAFWHATTATLHAPGQATVEISGEASYHFEAAEAMACLRAGATESASMPLDESLAIARTLEESRRQIGVVYPWER